MMCDAIVFCFVSGGDSEGNYDGNTNTWGEGYAITNVPADIAGIDYYGDGRFTTKVPRLDDALKE